MLDKLIKTAKKVVPMIYAYITPEIKKHNGWIKIGYTENDVSKRLNQQTHTADIEYKEEWRGTAIFDDGSGDIFKDTDFHTYLRKSGIENKKGTEWFHISGNDSKMMFYDFKSNRGILNDLKYVSPYKLRKEQEDAINQTINYKNQCEEGGEFLWNAKPRFGKTLSVYDFIKKINAKTVLIVTNRPAIANSWYSDYEKFMGIQSGYRFVSNTSSLQGKPLVLTREEYVSALAVNDIDKFKCIEFVSLQDLKGSVYFGGKYNKLGEVANMEWDLLVIDEAHEGIDTYKTDMAFDHISRKFTLHLSGTPFKALANDKFSENAIYNWTYADEQSAKANWNSEEPNPYETLPKLNLFTYQMSEIIKDELDQGIEINGETEEYAFDLNEFFKTDNGKFVHDSSVDKFLNALTTQLKYPFSTDELRSELRHTFWLLDRVDSAKALVKKLENHPVFKEYKVILAAGDGKIDNEEVTKKSYDKVIDAIKKYDKTITLSVGQLTTGITIPEWTAVLMLSNMKSPSLYMQSAFRAQNPCLFSNGKDFYRKENAYVFDFDPARTLVIFEEFANDLSSNTTNGKGDTEIRKQNVRDLLNFFPVIGEDENGEMIELDAEKVFSIPRKIRSQEVVKRGFMSDFLFQNIGTVFHAPSEVIEIISNFTPVGERKKVEINNKTAKELSIDENGDVTIDDEYVIGKSAEVFGEKIFDDISNYVKETAETVEIETKSEEKKAIDKFKDLVNQKAIQPIIDAAKQEYKNDIKQAEKKQIEKKLLNDSDKLINKVFDDYHIELNIIEKQRNDELSSMVDKDNNVYDINEKYDKRQEEMKKKLQETLSSTIDDFVKDATADVVKNIETKKKEREKETIEDSVKDHLRGFSRTIPSFLMAYGDENVTLSTFDKIIPDEVFKEVTSITLDQFRFLRDGGTYIDKNTGEEKQFMGNLFEPVVFDDSIKEFMRLRKTLANYFDEENHEDIFDYIPPQKTNQIFTPKQTVKKMVDMLEEENPGCFDSPDKTFIDLYMKSGLYITEIVKRLYQSEKMKELYPNTKDRLEHIFEKQVYGLAPTEIIYRISMNYILGFDESLKIEKHNFKQIDSLSYAKDGELGNLLKELFG